MKLKKEDIYLNKYTVVMGASSSICYESTIKFVQCGENIILI